MKQGGEGFASVENSNTVPENLELPLQIYEIDGDLEDFFYNEHRYLREGQIAHFVYDVAGSPFPRENKFIFLKTFRSLHYVFYLTENISYPRGQRFALSFKTLEYEYAITNLSQEDLPKLFEMITVFVNSVASYLDNSFSEIFINPEDASYTYREIDLCVNEILSSPNNRLSKDELLSEYKGPEIFGLYHKLFGRNFHEINYTIKSKSKARSRLFKSMSKKYFLDWDLVENKDLGPEFILRRKNYP